MYKFFDSSVISKLDIKSNVTVIVKPIKNNKYIEVEISGGTEEDIKSIIVEHKGTTLYIKDNFSSNSNNVVISYNNNVMNFRGNNVSNTSIINSGINFIGEVSGTVTINGKSINLNDLKDVNQKDEKSIVITIYTPSINLDLRLSESATFTAFQSFYSANIDACHSSIAYLSCVDLMINSSNSSKITADLLGGDVLINSSNSSNVSTKGNCLGNYIASACNSSYIYNEAIVSGRKTQNISNSAEINL